MKPTKYLMIFEQKSIGRRIIGMKKLAILIVTPIASKLMPTPEFARDNGLFEA